MEPIKQTQFSEKDASDSHSPPSSDQYPAQQSSGGITIEEGQHVKAKKP